MRRDAPNSPEAVCVLSADITASSQSRRDNTKILMFAIAFCTVMMIVEGIGGVAAHSLAVLSDAVHMLADVFTLCISLFAAYASTWSSNASYSFGWKRAEVVGAMASVLTTWGLVVWISLSALGRTADILACAMDTHREGCEVLDTPLMMGLGVFGFAMNIVLAAILHYGGVHAHSHGSLTPCDHGHSHEAHTATHDDHHNHHHQHDHQHNHNHNHSHSHSCNDHNGEEEEHHNGDRCSAVKVDSREGDEAVVSGDCIVVEAMNEEGASSHAHHDHSHGSDGGATSMNVRAALLHVIGDCLQALGVVVAAGVMWVGNKVTEGVTSSAHSYWNLADPLLSLLFGVITIMTTRHLIVEVLEILMEQVPRSVHYEELVDEISSIQHVVAIADLHVWAVSPAMTVMCCTVSVAKTTSTTESERLTQRIKKQCNQLGIQHCTTQITYV